MLTDVLTPVRTLLDEAYEACEFKHATNLSKLCSTIESAILHEESIGRRYVSLEQVSSSAAELVSHILTIAASHLNDAEHQKLATTLRAVVPQVVADSPECERLRKEASQVRRVFDNAIIAKDVAEVVRMAQMLVTKSRLLTRHQIAAGLLVEVSKLSDYREPFIAAAKACRDAAGKPKWDAIIDEFYAEASRA